MTDTSAHHPMTDKGGVRRFFSLQRLIGPSATVVGTNALTSVLRLVNTIILTRLLAPDDFGVIGIIMSIIYTLSMLTEIGFYAYVVRHERGEEKPFLDAVWTIHVLRGIGLTAILLLAAAPLSEILGKPAIAPLLAVTSLMLLIDCFHSLAYFTAVRTGMVRKLSMLELCGFLAQMFLGLLAAWLLASAWAIVIAILVNYAVRTVGSYLFFPGMRRSIRFDRDIALDFWRFSRVYIVSSILTLLIMQTDKLVLARVFSLEEFGVYTVAGNLAVAPVVLATSYLSRIAYPQFAAAWRDRPDGMRALNYRLRGIVFYGYLFAAGGLIGVGPLVVRILYDTRYLAAGTMLQWLAVSTALIMMTRIGNELLLATGRTVVTVQANIVRLVWLLIVGTGGFLLIGPMGIVVAVALIELPAYLFGIWSQHRLGLIDAKWEIVALATIAAGSALGAACNLLALTVFPSV